MEEIQEKELLSKFKIEISTGKKLSLAVKY